MEDVIIQELKRKRVLAKYQEYMVNVNGQKDQQASSPLQIGQMSGRAVKQIEIGDSKTSRLNQIYASAAREDRLFENYVNTVKKSESLSKRHHH